MSRPALDPRSLQEALDAIYSAQPLHSGHPLFAFLLVRHRLQQPEALAGDHASLFIIREILESCFSAVLGDRRELDPQEQLRRDFKQGNAFIESYSFLYYRYMRPDLQLTVEQIAAWANMAVRSLQRRQQEGLGYLVLALTEQEVELRRAEKLIHLRLRVPYPPNRVLYGREKITDRIIASLASGAVLVTGQPQIGKSILVSAVCHQVVAQFDDLFWISLHPHRDCLSQIARHIGGGLESYSIEEMAVYCTHSRVLLILDDLHDQHTPDLTHTFFQYVSVIGISTSLLTDWQGIVIDVPALTVAAARQFFDDYRGDIAPERFTEINDHAQGIPGSLLEYIHLNRLALQGKTAQRDYFRQKWELLDTETRFVWFLAYLAPASLAALRDFFRLSVRSIQQLTIYGIIIHEEKEYRLAPAARNTVAEIAVSQLSSDIDLHTYVTKFIEINQRSDDLRIWLTLLTSGLTPYLDPEDTRRLLNYCAIAIALMSRWNDWIEVLRTLEHDLPDTPYWRCWLELEQARLLRWQGRFADDLRKLGDIIQRTGNLGFFDIYARALLEFGLVASYREQATALDAIQDAERNFQRLTYPLGIDLARITRARLLLPHDPEDALRIVQSIPLDAALIIASEAALQLQDWQAAVQYATRIVEQTPLHSPMYGRVLSLLARTLWHTNELLLALDYQQQAINILNTSSDMVGLTRALNNLGVIYDSLNEREKAKETWETALKLCLRLQDAVALDAIRYNLELRFKDEKLRLL